MATIPNHNSILQQAYLSQKRSITVNLKDVEEIKEVKEKKQRKYLPGLIGLIIGILICGIILAPVLTMYISSQGQYIVFFTEKS
jgi:hypothetical protein